MSTKTKTTPNGAPTQHEPPTTYRVNTEVEGKIDAYIRDNPKFWNYLQQMPRDRLERTVVLDEVRKLERQQRINEGSMKRINADPKLRQAYETLVKDVPEEQREDVMTQMERQKARTVARSQSQTQQQSKGETVGA